MSTASIRKLQDVSTSSRHPSEEDSALISPPASTPPSDLRQMKEASSHQSSSGVGAFKQTFFKGPDAIFAVSE